MNKKDYEEFLRHCQVLQKLSPNRILLKVLSTSQLLVQRKLQNFSSELIPILSQQKQISHEHIESVIDYCQVSSDCVAVFTEYSTHTLDDQLIARRKSNTRFSLEELENVMVSVLKALSYLETKAIGHGCVSRKDIVIASNGTVKLIDPALATSSPLNLISGYYYSPELLAQNYRRAQSTSGSISDCQNDNIDFFKNDIFVLGLFIVELGLLHTGLEDCLRYDEGYFDYEVLDGYLNQFQCLYANEPFISLLCGMLQEDPASRLTSQGALNFIQEQFQGEDEEEEEGEELEDSSGSSYLYESKDKTVKSFLLSQGPTSSLGESLQQSQQSNPKPRLSINRMPQKTGRTPLIRC